MANFITIDSEERLESLFRASHAKPVILFKHSNSCGISSGVFNEVSQVNNDINLIIVQNARNVSNIIAERTGIRHESPQAIVLKHGKPVYNASHYDITAEDLDSATINF
jgi:bacillithiol system protein YtxJ